MKIINRKAKFKYEFLDKVEAGIALIGPEVKSIKQGKINLGDAYVRVDPNQEVWLVNANIAPYAFADNRNYNPTRSRKLLLHKQEILSLVKKMESKNLVLVPSSCYTVKKQIKIEVALAKAKKQWQKKEVVKRRDLEREMQRELKNYTT